MKVEETEKEVIATSVSWPEIKATGQTRRSAIAKLNQELQTAHRAGKLKR